MHFLFPTSPLSTHHSSWPSSHRHEGMRLILSGPSNCGKSTLAFHFAYNCALNHSSRRVLLVQPCETLPRRTQTIQTSQTPLASHCGDEEEVHAFAADPAVLSRIDVKYVASNDDLVRLLANLHLMQHVPVAVVIDDCDQICASNVSAHAYVGPNVHESSASMANQARVLAAVANAHEISTVPQQQQKQSSSNSTTGNFTVEHSLVVLKQNDRDRMSTSLRECFGRWANTWISASMSSDTGNTSTSRPDPVTGNQSSTYQQQHEHTHQRDGNGNSWSLVAHVLKGSQAACAGQPNVSYRVQSGVLSHFV